jgi:hypothetical protein
MPCASLTDDELWRAIGDNTNVDAAIAASDGSERRAKFRRVHLNAVNRLQREYSECSAELTADL